MQVSDETQNLFMKLVAWECFGAQEYDPKDLLREVPLSDLRTVSRNIKSQGAEMKNFACVSMVELELLYKTGLLAGDWHYTRRGDKVNITYDTVACEKTTCFELMDVGALEHLTPVCARA